MKTVSGRWSSQTYSLDSCQSDFSLVAYVSWGALIAKLQFPVPPSPVEVVIPLAIVPTLPGVAMFRPHVTTQSVSFAIPMSGTPSANKFPVRTNARTKVSSAGTRLYDAVQAWNRKRSAGFFVFHLPARDSNHAHAASRHAHYLPPHKRLLRDPCGGHATNFQEGTPKSALDLGCLPTL